MVLTYDNSAEQGTPARDSTKFKEAVEMMRSWRKKETTCRERTPATEEKHSIPAEKLATGRKMAGRPTIRDSGRLRIRDMMPWNIQALIHKKQKLQRKFEELFEPDEDTDALEISISPDERHLIETSKHDDNNHCVPT